MASNYKNYTDSAKDFYSQIVEQFNSKALTAGENVKENLAKWQNVNNIFIEEMGRFFDVIGRINLELLTDCNNDVAEYVEQSNSDSAKVYVEYYLNFYNNISTLKQYCLNIFN